MSKVDTQSRYGDEGNGLSAFVKAVFGDISGAFADLGTFLPLTLGVLSVSGMAAEGVLFGFGVFALATAAIYRRPIPIQPMKAVAAITIATGLTGPDVATAGLVIGVILTFLAAVGAVGFLARIVPAPVLSGLQMGIGLSLVWYAFGLGSGDWPIVLGLAAGLFAATRTWAGPFVSIAAVAAGVAWTLSQAGGLPGGLSAGFHFPAFAIPAADSWTVVLRDIVPAQIAMTLTNAVLATAVLAAQFFPHDTERLTPRRLALSSGLLNLLLAPFGAMPMCHGAGGLAAQYRFGARTWLTPAIFGTACLLLGVLYGNEAMQLLALFPLPLLAAFLMVAGAELAISKRHFDYRQADLGILLLTGLMCLFVNVAAGLAVGMIAHALAGYALRRRET